MSDKEIILRAGFQVPDSLTVPKKIFRRLWTLSLSRSCRIRNMEFEPRSYKATSIVLCLLIGSPLWNFGIRN